MTDTGVEYRREGTSGLIVLDSPNRNALTPEFADAVVDGLEQAEGDPEVTALVLASAGPSFCSGADLGMLTRVGADPLADENFAGIGRIYGMFERLREARIPTVAAVNGTLVGAGLNLPLACDLRIVSDDLRLIGFGRAGVHPGGGHLAMLARHVHGGAGAAIALFNQEMRAEQALATGFAWQVVPREELLTTALDIAASAGSDGDLTRAVTRTYRAVDEDRPTPRGAVLMERAPQVWSMQRRLRRT
ncbi:enoyl-CoA hydratase/isomerase family protein [Amycolatopsis sp. YIM 10]|uniref:enoyl-CoA hydratase/isomerase family protein n=1 Tax=Amycolatopsis sp. YIM 10 TaxID=2653857 RepID=UPI00129010AB|nr:enoyl-CoA hydratase/isomerase family protein [Amycolatopsis sp. YIM 10]QFU89555.1 putative enoyl-CoA hydratase echA14 [Amycolatopsis sp. YIM 10]